MRVGLGLVVVVAVVAALVVGRGSGDAHVVEVAEPVVPLAAPGEARARPASVVGSREAVCRPGELVPLRSDALAQAAQAKRPLAARSRPGGPVVARFGTVNVNGAPTVFGVLAARLGARCTPSWYRVQLPLRPNGRIGWVRAGDVSVRPIETRIVVDLSDRRVTLYRGNHAVLQAVAAIGKPGTPTPTGSYYVNQRLVAPDPSGPFGPGGIGISAFSPTLQDWSQGGPIAIHGTNVPQFLGQAVSYGCVRVGNAQLQRLWDLAPEGTPVEIRS